MFILSNRAIDFAKLKPTAPEFQLAGDSERVALTCADLGVRADELELPVPLDKLAYRNALDELQNRGIIGENGRLSKYGKPSKVCRLTARGPSLSSMPTPHWCRIWPS